MQPRGHAGRSPHELWWASTVHACAFAMASGPCKIHLKLMSDSALHVLPVRRVGSIALSTAAASSALVWNGSAGLYDDMYGSAEDSCTAGAASGMYNEASSLMRHSASASLNSSLQARARGGGGACARWRHTLQGHTVTGAHGYRGTRLQWHTVTGAHGYRGTRYRRWRRGPPCPLLTGGGHRPAHAPNGACGRGRRVTTRPWRQT